MTGSLHLGPTASLALDWVPADTASKFGGDYVVASYESRTGTFETVGGGSEQYSIGEAYVAGVDYVTGDKVTVSLHTLLDGDTDLDGRVGLLDWDTFRDNFGSAGTDWTQGNFDPWNNSLVDLDDWDKFRNNFGSTVPAAASAAMNVPEPSTFVLLCMGAVGLLAYGWRRRHSS